jgi:hypothetical protein
MGSGLVRARTRVRLVAALMLVEAASLAVASGLHLSGRVAGRGNLYDAGDAGIAEAVIGAVLLAAAVLMLRRPGLARAAGLAAGGFATLGFLVGLSITARGGHWPDIAYHLTVLPLLVGGLFALWRAGPPRQPARAPDPGRDRGAARSGG